MGQCLLLLAGMTQPLISAGVLCCCRCCICCAWSGWQAAAPHACALPSPTCGRLVQVLRLLRLVRLAKLFRILRAGHILQRWEVKLAINYSVVQLTKSVVVVMVCAHWLACGYHLVVILESSTVSWGSVLRGGGEALGHTLAGLQAPPEGHCGEQHEGPGGFVSRGAVLVGEVKVECWGTLADWRTRPAGALREQHYEP